MGCVGGGGVCGVCVSMCVCDFQTDCYIEQLHLKFTPPPDTPSIRHYGCIHHTTDVDISCRSIQWSNPLVVNTPLVEVLPLIFHRGCGFKSMFYRPYFRYQCFF